MYLLRNTDNGTKVVLRAASGIDNGGINVDSGYTPPSIEVTLVLKEMFYTARSAVYDCTVKGEGAFSHYFGGMVAASINNTAIFTKAISDITWNRFKETFEVILPYEADGTMDNINLKWTANSTGGMIRTIEVNTTKVTGFIRPLQAEPFFIKSPYYYQPAGYVNNFWQDESWFINEHETLTYKLCVPYVPADANKLKLALPVQGAGDMTVDMFWEEEIDSPVVGIYEGSLLLDGEARIKLHQVLKGTGGSQTIHVTQFLIGFAIGGNYEAPVSYAEPFQVVASMEQPIVLGTVRDTNAATIALTGDDSVLILHESNALATIQAEAATGAVIKEKSIQNGNEIMLNYNEFLWEDVQSPIFYFGAKDNRNFSAVVKVEAPYIDYIKPSAIFKGSIITGTGVMNFKVNGNYYSGSFGLVDNEIFVYYRYKLQGAEDSEYTDWIRLTDIDVRAESRSYVVEGAVSGLDYNKAYVFQAHIADALNTVYGADYVAISVPIFDWSNEDFNFNVPVTVMGARIGGDNPVLWSGNDNMAADAVANLSALVSAQMHGIVLVFSSGTGDVSWSTHFVPKIMTKINNGGGQTFLMANNAGLAVFGAKYLYIYDDRIEGHTSNYNSTSTTSASGIKAENAYFTLRYVIGV